MPTLTTDDIRAYAARHLASLVNCADIYHAQAVALPGNPRGLTLGSLIEHVTDAAGISMHVLADLALRHGDLSAYDDLYTLVDAAQNRMIEQAGEARMSSVPGWCQATKGFAAKKATATTAGPA